MGVYETTLNVSEFYNFAPKSVQEFFSIKCEKIIIYMLKILNIPTKFKSKILQDTFIDPNYNMPQISLQSIGF